MRVFKPLEPSLLYKTFEWEKQQRFVASVLIGFPLDGSDPLLEPDLWKFLSEELGKDAMLDMCMPKPRGEVLVHGRFFAPGAQPVPAGRVRLRMETIDKELAVIGDRRWRLGIGATAPAPMTEMPVTWQNAFGGEGFRKNPQGKGFQPETDEIARKRHPLPNIENPKQLISSPDDRPDPAGFGSLDFQWPQRFSKVGTYDEKWLKERFPGPAEDMDWTCFNAAPPDQWISGYFKGDEPFELHHMHPEKPVLKSRLPGFRTRCFILQETPDGEAFREISMRAETVWLFPHAEIGILLWRGAITIEEDDASDVKNMILAYENISDAPRTPEHYQAAIEKRLDPDNGWKYLMTTKEMIPEGAICGFARLMQQSDATEGYFRQNMEAMAEQVKKEAQEKLDEQKEQIAAQLRAMNVDPEPYLKKMSLNPEASDDSEKEAEEMAKAQKKIIADKLRAADIDPEPYLKKMKVEPQQPAEDPHLKEIMATVEKIAPGITEDPKHLDLEKIDLSKMDELRQKMDEMAEAKKQEAKEKLLESKEKLRQQLENMPKNEAAGDLKKRSETKEAFDKINEAIEKMDGPYPLPRPPGKEIVEQFRAQINTAKDQIEELRQKGILKEQEDEVIQEKMDGLSANLKEAIARIDRIDADDIEKKLENASVQIKDSYRMGAHYMDYGLPPHEGREKEIAGEMLAAYRKGKSLADGDYAGVNLSGHDLSGIDLSNSFLEDVNFANAKLKGANLSKAILARADLTNADLTGANMGGANLGAASLKNADLSDSDLSNAILSKADLTDAKLIRCKMEGVYFLEAALSRADMSESLMDAPIFLEVDVSGAKFCKTNLANAIFLKARLTGTDFTEATAERFICVESVADNAVFSRANFALSCFPGGCSLRDTDFRNVTMNQSNFMDTDLENADFSSANVNMSGFGGANLKNAKFHKASAKRSMFMKADLSNADMRSINLMEGSLMKARLSGADFRNANLYSVDFMKAILGETDFTGANLDLTQLQNWQPL